MARSVAKQTDRGLFLSILGAPCAKCGKSLQAKLPRKTAGGYHGGRFQSVGSPEATGGGRKEQPITRSP